MKQVFVWQICVVVSFICMDFCAECAKNPPLGSYYQSQNQDVNSQQSNQLTRNPNNCRDENKRLRGKWRCDNGQIIDCQMLCNGSRNCADGSDETAFSCRNIFCAESAFRCAYGGCVPSELECNGIAECADASDEKTINCPGVLHSLQAKGDCNNGFFKCTSGECIHEDEVCNGDSHCRDSSDESAGLCLAHYCPTFGFRCDYGACIGRHLRCNGKWDCYDGSDEKLGLCKV